MQKKQSQNRPGRPRAFSEEGALDAAMSVFAAKGYDSASLGDLERAMRINRVSMYATFGNKEALFVKAMKRYTELGSRRLLQCLGTGSAKDGFETVLRESASMFTDPHGHGVCFVTQAPLTRADVSVGTKRFMAERRADIDLMLGRRLQQAIDKGELEPGTPVSDVARFFTVVILGLALQAQHGATQSELMRVVDVAMTSWPVRGRRRNAKPRRRQLGQAATTPPHEDRDRGA